MRDIDNFEADRAEFIKARIKDMRQRDPKLSFVDCWNRLQREHPSLFTEVPDKAPTPKATLTARGNLDLFEIARRANVPARIAATPDGQELLKVTGPQLELIQAAKSPKIKD